MRIAPEAAAPAPDRMPDSLAGGTPEPLRSGLIGLLGADRVLARASDLVRYASDASPYRMIPRCVVMAHDVDDVVKVMDYARRTGVPITFRAAGTSLNGQAQGDGVMVDVRRHWRGVQVEDGGATGTRAARHAARLRERGARAARPPPRPRPGLDGHRDGRRSHRQQLRRDALRRRARLLPDGARADVRAAVGHRDRHRRPRAEEQFAAREPELARGLLEIRDEIRADADLSSASAASSRSRTRWATGSSRSSTPTRRSRSSAA